MQDRGVGEEEMELVDVWKVERMGEVFKWVAAISYACDEFFVNDKLLHLYQFFSILQVCVHSVCLKQGFDACSLKLVEKHVNLGNVLYIFLIF